MFKRNYRILIFSLVVISLGACSRQQQGVDTIFVREKPSDFTTLPAEQQPPKIQVPPIPGKAVITGGPFVDYQTQTGRSASVPGQPVQPTLP